MEEAQEGLSPLAKLVEWTFVGLFFVGILASIYGFVCLVTGLWGLVWNGQFDGQPFWQFLGLEETQRTILNWDRSAFLIVGGIVFCTVVADVGDSAMAWLSKTPEQRASERALAQEEADRNAWNEKLRKEAAKLDNARKSASRPPMSGWRRLWIVLSILSGVPVFLIAYSDASSGNAYITADEKIRSLEGQEFWNKLFEQAKRERPELQSCELATLQMTHSYDWSYSVTCDRRNAFLPALLWALFPAVVMWTVGKTTRWVYRGFRPPKTAPKDKDATDGEP